MNTNTPFALNLSIGQQRTGIFNMVWPLAWLTAKLLLALASTGILGSRPHETHDHILLSDGLSQIQNRFKTGGLRPISGSLRQAPWDSRPKIFFQLNPWGHSPYVTSMTRGWVCLLWIRFAYYWKLFLLHCIQVLCQFRICKADHICLTYLMQ
jgi:hypothetical protein